MVCLGLKLAWKGSHFIPIFFAGDQGAAGCAVDGARWGHAGGYVAPCSLSPAPIKQMELGNEAASAAGTTWEFKEHLVRRSSIFPLEPIKFTETHELSADLIKLK